MRKIPQERVQNNQRKESLQDYFKRSKEKRIASLSCV
jgi:hypothetical protein